MKRFTDPLDGEAAAPGAIVPTSITGMAFTAEEALETAAWHGELEDE
ncbi:MAG: hypothetical protein JWO10_1728 [Microbacteriaceae bacterium]|nr:hypothetical protein [Microbacteriaceae bacterium]